MIRQCSQCLLELKAYAPSASLHESSLLEAMSYKDIITIEPGKRGGKPCIRGMRITVYDVLGYLASGMTYEEILNDFPYLTKDDILACLEYAAERERHTTAA